MYMLPQPHGKKPSKKHFVLNRRFTILSGFLLVFCVYWKLSSSAVLRTDVVPRSVFDNIGLSNDAAAAGAGGVGLPRKSINLDLPEKLRTKLDAFLQADVCKRWETSENGEDVFRMILEVYFDAFDQRVPLNQVAEETFEMRLPGLSIPGLGSLDWFPFVVTTPFQFISDYVFTYLDKAKEDEDESNENYRFFASPGRNPIPDRDGDLIFVHARMGTRFREEILPYITTKFILITHEHDIPPRDMAIMLEDPKLIHWFAQNPDLVHEKVTPIPIGTTAKFASRAGEFTAFRSEMLNPHFYSPDLSDSEKKGRPNLLLANFDKSHNIKRQIGLLTFKDVMTEIPKTNNFTEYLDHVVHSKFVLSPPGYGEDCYRTWESILFGSIPIVNDFPPLNPLFKDSPIMTLKTWEKGYQKEELEQLQIPTNSRKLMLMQYWADRIKCLKSKHGL